MDRLFYMDAEEVIPFLFNTEHICNPVHRMGRDTTGRARVYSAVDPKPATGAAPSIGSASATTCPGSTTKGGSSETTAHTPEANCHKGRDG